MKPILKIGQAPGRQRANPRAWPARLTAKTVARYALLTAAGVLLYKLGAAYALRERGYFAVGGEAVFLLLPILYCLAAAVIRDIARYRED